MFNYTISAKQIDFIKKDLKKATKTLMFNQKSTD
jgi:hypothetical protein